MSAAALPAMSLVSVKNQQLGSHLHIALRPYQHLSIVVRNKVEGGVTCGQNNVLAP